MLKKIFDEVKDPEIISSLTLASAVILDVNSTDKEKELAMTIIFKAGKLTYINDLTKSLKGSTLSITHL